MSLKMDKASIFHAARLDAENDINNNMEKDDDEPEVKGSGSEKQYEFISYGESEDWSYFYVWKFFFGVGDLCPCVGYYDLFLIALWVGWWLILYLYWVDYIFLFSDMVCMCPSWVVFSMDGYFVTPGPFWGNNGENMISLKMMVISFIICMQDKFIQIQASS